MQVNKTNLKLVLTQIQKRAEAGEPMLFTSLCNNYHLGETTRNKLRWALLEHEYQIAKSETPLKKMYLSRDKKVWKFKFRTIDGSRNYVLATDEAITYAMSLCPKEIANPSYYKKYSNTSVEEVPVTTEEIRAEIDLSGISTEELAAELFKRGWVITFGGII